MVAMIVTVDTFLLRHDFGVRLFTNVVIVAIFLGFTLWRRPNSFR